MPRRPQRDGIARRLLLFLFAIATVATLVYGAWMVGQRHPMSIRVLRPINGLPSLEVVYTGLDLSEYPGEAAMRRLKSESPYVFVGYYLQSPSHPGNSWMGRWRAELSAANWGVAILYVGQQRSLLTAEQGKIDADDAAEKSAAEGFPENAVVFLDIEAMDELSEGMANYAAAWTQRLSHRDGHRFRAGIYCHVKNARALKEKLGELTYWVAGGQTDFDWSAHPARSGISFAHMWQGALDSPDPSGVIHGPIDVSTSLSRNPSDF